MTTYPRLRFAVLAGFVAVAAVGCGSENSGPKQSMSQVGQQINAADQERAAAQAEAERKAKEEADAAAAVAAAQPVEPLRVEAGRASIGEGGYLTAIAGARRHVLNKVDDLAWTQGVQHFQASEGRLPKDHNEFMKKIVEPLGIDLGFKEEGTEFLYDPTPSEEHPWGTLYVVAADAASAPQQ